MEKGKWLSLRIFGGFLFLLLSILVVGREAQAGSIYSSPYVTFSPDRKAFTTNAGDRSVAQYPGGLVRHTGTSPSLRNLYVGEHYYTYYRSKNVPVGYWRVENLVSQCIHNAYLPPDTPFHQLNFKREPCRLYYFSGWRAYCGDCGGSLTPMYVYMSKEAAASIAFLDLDMTYYYLCPFCTNLEQGVALSAHRCRGISNNRYQVRYEANAPGVSGSMRNSVHMYNNALSYEGAWVMPETRLRKNAYYRKEYLFVGWNTRPDGTGQEFADQQEIFNLTQENYDGSGRGVVVLYAQWVHNVSILRIDPAGGTYQGSAEVKIVEQECGSSYSVIESQVRPPEGYTVTFDSQGGSYAAPLKSENRFGGWIKSRPFHGSFTGGIYYFCGGMGDVDTLTALYEKGAIILPEVERQSYRFCGWYYDPECERPAGGAGEQLVPQGDLTLYASWYENLELTADIERILEPHDPVFRCGESGILHFTAWGYADRVEVRFPENLSGEKFPGYSVTYQYDGQILSQQESIQFMLPLDMPAGEYEVIVTAYRGEETVREIPLFWCLGPEESVLKEIRTRLR